MGPAGGPARAAGLGTRVTGFGWYRSRSFLAREGEALGDSEFGGMVRLEGGCCIRCRILVLRN